MWLIFAQVPDSSVTFEAKIEKSKFYFDEKVKLVVSLQASEQPEFVSAVVANLDNSFTFDMKKEGEENIYLTFLQDIPPGLYSVRFDAFWKDKKVSSEPLLSFEVLPRDFFQPPTRFAEPNPVSLQRQGVNFKVENWSQIKIFDSSGALLKVLLYPVNKWDLTDEAGQKVKPGFYYFLILNGSRVIAEQCLEVVE